MGSHSKNSTAFGSEKRTFNFIKKWILKAFQSREFRSSTNWQLTSSWLKNLDLAASQHIITQEFMALTDQTYIMDRRILHWLKLSRRSADPRMMMACIGRANARWQLNYHHAVRPGLAPLFQIWAWCIVTGFVASYHNQ